MDIRRADPGEAAAILLFWKQSGASLSTTDEVDYVRHAIVHPSAVLLIAEEAGAIAGTVLGTFDGWRGNIYRLVVEPSHRRRRVGTNLVRHMETIFGEWGVRRITVLVESDRPWASAFWAAVGYPYDERIVRHLGIMDASGREA